MPTIVRSRSLRTKILSWSLLPMVLALAAIALVSHFAYQTMARDLVLERDRELTRLLAEQLGSQLADFAGTPRNLSRVEGIFEQEIMTEQSLFRRLVARIRPRTGQKGIAYLVNADGVAILHSDRTRVGSSLQELPAVAAVLAGEIGSQRLYDDQGIDTLTSYAPVPGTSWGLVIEQPWSSLTASITGYQRAILALTTGALVLLAGLVLFGVRRTIRPLRDLASAARALSDGNFEARVAATTGDEIEALAVQFNRMATRLRDSYRALEDRAKRRERELAMLNAVTVASSLERKLPLVLQSSLAALGGIPGFEAAAIWTMDPASGQLALAARHGDLGCLQSLTSAPGAAELQTRLADGPPDSSFISVRPDNSTLIGVPIMIRGCLNGLLGVVLQTDQEPDSEELHLLTTVGQQIGLALESHRLFDDAAQRADLFRLISDVGGHITAILSLPELAEAIVDSIHARLGYDRVAIGLVENERVVIKAGAGGGWKESSLPHPSHILGGQDPIGRVAATGQSLLVPDVDPDPRFVQPADSRRSCSELVVPLRTGNTVLGVLDVQSGSHHPFTEVDQVVLESLAAQAAIAIENARLAERSHDIAVMEERTRIARDLHDAVSQTLWTAGLIADVLPDLWETSRAEGMRSLRQLQRLTRGALAELRMLLLELRPAALSSADLGSLLRHLADGNISRKDLAMIVSVRGGNAELPADVKIGLYRIAQEAVTNVVKHASATRVTLALETRGSVVRLRIEDNGCAPETPGGRPDGCGLGMDIMRERAESMGARLTVERGHEGGVCVEVVWPAPTETATIG